MNGLSGPTFQCSLIAQRLLDFARGRLSSRNQNKLAQNKEETVWSRFHPSHFWEFRIEKALRTKSMRPKLREVIDANRDGFTSLREAQAWSFKRLQGCKAASSQRVNLGCTGCLRVDDCQATDLQCDRRRLAAPERRAIGLLRLDRISPFYNRGILASCTVYNFKSKNVTKCRV